MNTKQQIKDLFNSLTQAEQVELLRELNSHSSTSLNIAEFCKKHQQKFGCNIEFEITQSGLDHAPTIEATVITSFGNFKGHGSNQKIAKAKAVEKAWAYANW